MERTYLLQCEAAKPVFISKLIEDLKDGDPGCTHVTRAGFDRVFIPAFTRPSNLRQYVLYRTSEKGNRPENGPKGAERESVISAQ